MSATVIIVLIVVILLMVFIIATYNRLIQEIETVKNNQKQIDVQLD